MSKDLELAKREIKEAQERVREATRKRAAADAKATSLKTEADQAMQTRSELEMSVASCKAQLVEALHAKQALEEECESLNAQLLKAQQEGQEKLETVQAEAKLQISTLTIEIDQLKRAVQVSEDRVAASKSASKQTTQIVRDLKTELLKSQKTPPASPASPGADRLTRELADRLEVLLKDNAVLREKVKYLEDIVQVLTMEVKGKRT